MPDQLPVMPPEETDIFIVVRLREEHWQQFAGVGFPVRAGHLRFVRQPFDGISGTVYGLLITEEPQ